METIKQETCVQCVDPSKAWLPIPGAFLPLHGLWGLLLLLAATIKFFRPFSITGSEPIDTLVMITLTVAMVIGLLFLAIYIRTNVWGTRLYCSIDGEDNLHFHRREDRTSLKVGGTSCKFWSGDPTDPGRLVVRGPGTIILELRFGWLRRCKIHFSGADDNKWAYARIWGKYLVLKDRRGETISLQVFYERDARSSSLDYIPSKLCEALILLRHHDVESLVSTGVKDTGEDMPSVRLPHAAS